MLTRRLPSPLRGGPLFSTGEKVVFVLLGLVSAAVSIAAALAIIWLIVEAAQWIGRH